MSWIKTKLESLLTPITLENWDSIVHHLIEWVITFSEVTLGPKASINTLPL